MANPCHWVREGVFISPFRRPVEEVVDTEQFVKATTERGIGMEDIPRGVFGERAEAGRFFRREVHGGVVVDFPGSQFLLAEGDLEVVVKTVGLGGHPGKTPTHAFLEGCDLLEGGTRDRGEGNVALDEVRVHTVKTVRRHRTTGTPFLPVRAKHEVVDGQLAAPIEEFGQGLLPYRGIKYIVLLNAYPGERAALSASRKWVSSFSFASSFLRAASHSACETIFGFATAFVAMISSPFSFGRKPISTVSCILESGTEPKPRFRRSKLRSAPEWRRPLRMQDT
jgi:hypothetical protein